MRKLFIVFIILLGFLEAKVVCPPESCGYSAPYKINTCNDLMLEMDFLYWQAIEDNLSIGATDTEILCVPFEFDPGFRAQAGMTFNWDNWQVIAEYTRYAQGIRRQRSRINIVPYWIVSDRRYSQTDAKWNLRYDSGAISLGRDAYVGKCSTARIHIGIEGMRVRQRMDVSYYNGQGETRSDNNLRSWAVGPRMGWDTKWFICSTFNFFSEVRGALLYTDFTTNDQEVYLNGDLVGKAIKGNECAVNPKVDISAGFGWGKCIRRMYFQLKAGYSATILWNQNQFIKNTSNAYSSNGDLYFHGLTLYFAFYF